MGSQPPRKSTGLIIGIVVAALVLLIVIGGIIMAVAGGGKDEPISTITPSAPPTPTTPPSPTTKPSATPTSTPTTKPTAAPSSSKPTDKPTKPPSGAAVDLGNGVKLTPAADWKVRSKKSGAAQLSNGEDVFVGIAAKLPKGSNPSQTCTGYHKELAKDYTNAKFADPENVDLGSKKLKGATCAAQVTVANGGDAVQVTIVSLVSIRTDGLTVVGSLYFTKNSDTKQLNSDFATMVNSMLKTQVEGG
ncbi:MAG: hypothetical protein L0H41_10520, partial [Microlunatus sp.]|nr:hypothetical protein [Microlunatus sp.]